MNVYFTGSLYPARIIIDNGSGSNGENPGENPNPGDNKGNATMVISEKIVSNHFDSKKGVKLA